MSLANNSVYVVFFWFFSIIVEVNNVVPIIDIITKKKSFNTFNNTINLSLNNCVSETESTCNKIKTIMYKIKITKNIISINPVIFCELWNFWITNMLFDFVFFISALLSTSFCIIIPYILSFFKHHINTDFYTFLFNPYLLYLIFSYKTTITLNYYAHATYASARAEMERLAA